MTIALLPWPDAPTSFYSCTAHITHVLTAKAPCEGDYPTVLPTESAQTQTVEVIANKTNKSRLRHEGSLRCTGVPAQHNLHHHIRRNRPCYRMPPAVDGSHALAIDRSTSGQLGNDTCCNEMLSRLSDDNSSSCRPPAANWEGLANRPSFVAEFHRQRVCTDAQSLPRYDRAVAAACMDCEGIFNTRFGRGSGSGSDSTKARVDVLVLCWGCQPAQGCCHDGTKIS
jgi:hypothetical protein